MKKATIKKNVRCLYQAILKNKRPVKLKELVGFYYEYDELSIKVNDLIKRVRNSVDVPFTSNVYMRTIKIPKYIEWIKGYLDNG
jgi:hypothetical protein